MNNNEFHQLPVLEVTRASRCSLMCYPTPLNLGAEHVPRQVRASTGFPRREPSLLKSAIVFSSLWLKQSTRNGSASGLICGPVKGGLGELWGVLVVADHSSGGAFDEADVSAFRFGSVRVGSGWFRSIRVRRKAEYL